MFEHYKTLISAELCHLLKRNPSSMQEHSGVRKSFEFPFEMVKQSLFSRTPADEEALIEAWGDTLGNHLTGRHPDGELFQIAVRTAQAVEAYLYIETDGTEFIQLELAAYASEEDGGKVLAASFGRTGKLGHLSKLRTFNRFELLTGKKECQRC